MTQETTGIDAVESALNNVLRFIMDGEPVLNERAPGERPLMKQFTTFMVYWGEGNAHVYRHEHETETGYIQRVEDDVYVTARIICYGKDSMKRCNGIRMTLNSDIQCIQVFKNLLGICDIDDAQSIPESNLDGTLRERAYFNFKFYARVAYDFDIDWFNKITLVLSVPALSLDSETDIQLEV